MKWAMSVYLYVYIYKSIEKSQVKIAPYKRCEDNMKPFFSSLLSPHTDHHLQAELQKSLFGIK